MHRASDGTGNRKPLIDHQRPRSLCSAAGADLPQPTALICGNDVLALGALIECRETALQVPEDISILGFDNLELSYHSSSPLPTIDVPTEQMGEVAS
jgi:DNA-binding LacI/PurR family transcriptional regulator